ncbi:MAG: hypothetical protein KDD33_06560, partial [Bdellovibrionales bacterium]|nr:hypothetical protein [Bdellovibrionales bacterium]
LLIKGWCPGGFAHWVDVEIQIRLIGPLSVCIEWVADLNNNNGQVMGNSGCNSFNNNNVNNSNASRCCFR